MNEGREPSHALPSRPTHIYALSDPAVGEIRYIGKTVRSPEHRLAEHFSKARRGKHIFPLHRWLMKCDGYGIVVLVSIIETVESGADWAERERHWINCYRSAGARLLNVTEGGEGFQGLPRTQEHRAKIALASKGNKAFLGRRHSPETIEKMRIARARQIIHPRTPESRAYQAAAQRGKQRGPMSEQTKAKISSAKMGRKLGPASAEWIAKLIARNTGRVLSAETRAKIGAAQRGRKQNLSAEALRVRRAQLAEANRVRWAKVRDERAI